MKKFLVVVFLSLWVATPSQAEDIRDFQIAGIGIGDSLLNFYSETEILDQKKITGFLFKNKEYFSARFTAIDNDVYEKIQVQIKDNDPKYIIHSLEGINFFKSMNSCKDDNKKISNDIKKLFPSSKKRIIETKHGADPSGKSFVYITKLNLKSGAAVLISCYDWSDEITTSKGWKDNLKVIIDSKEFNYWLNNKANK
jgi:hypothetical protein